MKDTDQIHTKDTEEQGITLPYLKKQLFFLLHLVSSE